LIVSRDEFFLHLRYHPVMQARSQARPLTGSSPFSARRTLTGPSTSLSGYLYPQNSLSGSPFSLIGRLDFTESRGQWSSVGFSKSRTPTIVNADLSPFLSGLALSRFRPSRYRTNCIPDSRCPIHRTSDACAG
jgi:hypothetical protein